MTTNDQTLNTDGQVATGGESSTPQESPDGLVGTIELAEKAAAAVSGTDPEGAKKTEGTEDEAKAKAEADKAKADEEEAKAKAEEAKTKAEAETKAKEQAESERFDKHPRFQKLIKDNTDLKERLARTEGKLEVIETRKTTEEPDYKDITTMSVEDLNEWRDEDPKAFYANLAKQARAEVKAELLDEMKKETTASEAKTLEQRQVETYEKYAEKNPDFDEMWDSGEIGRYMRDNPGHNAISAHMALTVEKRSGQSKEEIDAAIAKAVKETEDRILKEIKVKGAASVLGAGPSASPRKSDEIPDEIKNTEKYGGKTAVLVSRLRARRAAKEAGV